MAPGVLTSEPRVRYGWDTSEGGVAVRASQAIKSIALGSRVIGENPRPWEYDTTFAEPNGDDWVKIDAIVERQNGAIVELEVLRPREWATSQGLHPGRQIPLHLEELDVRGLASVTSVTPCPQIATGDGHVVTGRFITRHIGNLVRLNLSDGTEIRVTSTHPIWSQDRMDWIPAGELGQGEELDGIDGRVYVEGVDELGCHPAVYNLEVHGHHVYRVADVGVLVHNACQVALGLGDHLAEFAARVKAQTYGDIIGNWNTGNMDAVASNILEIMGDAKTIHFNLDGLVKSLDEIPDVLMRGAEGIRRQTIDPESGRLIGNITNWELFQIYSNQGFWDKTIFYLGGQVLQ